MLARLDILHKLHVVDIFNYRKLIGQRSNKLNIIQSDINYLDNSSLPYYYCCLNIFCYSFCILLHHVCRILGTLGVPASFLSACRSYCFNPRLRRRCRYIFPYLFKTEGWKHVYIWIAWPSSLSEYVCYCFNLTSYY